MKNKSAFIAAVFALNAALARAHDGYQVDLQAKTPRNAAVRSLLVPGWGQMFNGQPYKGVALFLATGGALAAGLAVEDKADGTYRDYSAKGVPGDALYDDYKREKNQSTFLLATAAGLWIYAVVDAYAQARVLPPAQARAAQNRPRVVLAPGAVASVWRFGGEK